MAGHDHYCTYLPSYAPENKHQQPCHAPYDPDTVRSRWKSDEVLEELAMHSRPATANRHRHACTHHPEEDEVRCKWRAGQLTTQRSTFSRASARGALVSPEAATTPSPASYHPNHPRNRSCNGSSGPSTPRSQSSPGVPALVTNLHVHKVVSNIGSSIQNVELSIKWCFSLQRELETLAYQSPHLTTLQLSVTDPDDPRWEAQAPVLDLGAETAPRMPSLTQLSLQGVPIPCLHVSGAPLPKLRYLRISNVGHVLHRPPYAEIDIGRFEALEALEVVQVTVHAPVDLSRLAACSERLRVLHINEMWGVGPEQPTHHRLLLPSCRVLAIRDSLSAMTLDLWAPKLKSLDLKVLRLSHLSLGPGGASHRTKHKPAAGKAKLPSAQLTLLPDTLPAALVEALRNHTQVRSIEFDSAAKEDMLQLRQEIRGSLVTDEQDSQETESNQQPTTSMPLGSIQADEGVGVHPTDESCATEAACAAAPQSHPPVG